MIVRPKYFLWILVTVVSSTWYLIDPQAKFAVSGLADGGAVAAEPPAIAGYAPVSLGRTFNATYRRWDFLLLSRPIVDFPMTSAHSGDFPQQLTRERLPRGNEMQGERGDRQTIAQ